MAAELTPEQKEAARLADLAAKKRANAGIRPPKPAGPPSPVVGSGRSVKVQADKAAARNVIREAAKKAEQAAEKAKAGE